MTKAKSGTKNPKDALGLMKVPVGLYPNVARIQACLVLAHSSGEFGEFNWRNAPVRMSIYLDSIDRHTIAVRAGQDVDPRTGLPHLAHINACTAIIMESEALGILIDDRYEKDAAAVMLEALTPAGYGRARRKVKPRPARTLDQVRAELAADQARALRARKRRRRAARKIA